MGIYIKGMEMPKRCLDCPMYDCYNYNCQLYAFGIPARYNRDGSTRPEWCELVELPEKHGDLIERKAIYLTDFEIAMCDGDYKEGMKMLLEKIESAPTIIPAEEGET